MRQFSKADRDNIGPTNYALVQKILCRNVRWEVAKAKRTGAMSIATSRKQASVGCHAAR